MKLNRLMLVGILTLSLPATSAFACEHGSGGSDQDHSWTSFWHHCFHGHDDDSDHGGSSSGQNGGGCHGGSGSGGSTSGSGGSTSGGSTSGGSGATSGTGNAYK